MGWTLPNTFSPATRREFFVFLEFLSDVLPFQTIRRHQFDSDLLDSLRLATRWIHSNQLLAALLAVVHLEDVGHFWCVDRRLLLV